MKHQIAPAGLFLGIAACIYVPNPALEDADENSTFESANAGDSSGTSEGTSSQIWCDDADLDGFGDPNDCIDVSESETPPAGNVPEGMATDCDDGDPDTFPGAAELENSSSCRTDADMDGYGDSTPSSANAEPGLDCDDGDPDTFPGAAELEDPEACMQDADHDGYGDPMPPAGAVPGSDCDDDDPETFLCALWCADQDNDGFGNPNLCTSIPAADSPPNGYVPNATDCIDAIAAIHPGAAFKEPEICTRDGDGDGYGDDDVKSQYPVADNGSDCNDADPAQVVCVEANPSCADTLGFGVQLGAMAWGGDGNYDWLWENGTTLDDAMIADPIATPSDVTHYTVMVSDGSGNSASDDVTVHVTNKAWVLGGANAECMEVGFLGVASTHSFANMNTTTCSTSNSDPTAYVCSTVHENVKITGTMVVNPPVDDDDYIGFVWGWQNSDKYYLLHWKQAMQNFGGCNSAAGMTVKRADRVQAYAVADFTCNTSTPNMTVLLTPAQTSTQGWVHGVSYAIELLYANEGAEITIVNESNNTVVANFFVADSTYPSGQFGTFDFSQIRACNGPWTSSCL